MKHLLIILSLISFSISGDFIPINNQAINYTQIFFKWPQINNSEYYEIIITDETDEQSYLYQSDNNSIIIDTHLYNLDNNSVWGNTHSWIVCGSGNNFEYCYDQKNFTIRYLPIQYPANVNI